jgi:hypothetical protein
MEKEFIPYEQALALKELGFDEPCLGHYQDRDETTLQGAAATSKNVYFSIGETNKGFIVRNSRISNCVLAPLYQQAFRWFYWKYHIKAEPLNFIGDKCTYRIHNGDYNTPIFYIPEEAELECLKKLIEICKKN